jgi:hypothetical protein
MTFENFKTNRDFMSLAPLEPEELEEFERERKKAGKKADDFVAHCYALHEAFRLVCAWRKVPSPSKSGLTGWCENAHR